VHVYEVCPRKDKRGADLISDVLPFQLALVWRAERGQQRNRLRAILQPHTCRDLRSRRRRQCDLDARAQERFPRALACDVTANLRPSATRQESRAMSVESAQAALGKFAEAVNTGEFDLFDQVVASNCIDHDLADGQVPRP
jgi:hypothetical protein